MLKLLIALDETPASQHAIEYMARITREPQVDVTLLTATPDAGRAETLYRRAAETLGAPIVRHVQRTEALDDALLAESQAGEYDLAIFGPMRERWSRWLSIRSRPSLSAQLPISSLLVRGAPRSVTRVLLCTGGDETVIEDARLAARLARRVGANATVLHVLSQMPVIFGARTPRERALEAMTESGAPEIANMNAALDVLRADGVSGQIKVRIGLVTDEIVAELQEGSYDLLVVGAHRSQGMVERLLLEDVTHDILGHSPVPVLVVKALRQHALP